MPPMTLCSACTSWGGIPSSADRYEPVTLGPDAPGLNCGLCTTWGQGVCKSLRPCAHPGEEAVNFGIDPRSPDHRPAQTLCTPCGQEIVGARRPAYPTDR